MPKKKTTKKKSVVEKIEKQVEKTAEDLGKEIGKITHYFDQIGVAVVELAKGLGVGEVIRVKGTTTDFKQKVDSMQIEHKEVEKAKKGDAIGLKVKDRVRPHDKVYIVEE